MEVTSTEMELSLGVKSPVLASSRILKIHEEKILVAMDVTLQKIRKLLMITTLCLYLSEDHQKFTRRRRKKVEAVVGKEASKLLGELVSCQKKLVDSLKPTPKLKEMSSSEAKAEIIRRLKSKPEKRQFLLKVLRSTKAFLTSMSNGDGISMADSLKKEEGFRGISPSSLSSSPFQMTPAETLNNGKVKRSETVTTSARKLLKDALHSKYRRHVQRCFKELDVESLMNILYLTYKDSTKTGVSPEIRSQFLSFSYNNEDEEDCFGFDGLDFEENGTESDLKECFWKEAEQMSSFADATHNSQSFCMQYGGDLLRSFQYAGSSFIEEVNSSEEDEQFGRPHLEEKLAYKPATTTSVDNLSQIKGKWNGVQVVDDPSFEIRWRISKLQTTLLGHSSPFSFEENDIPISETESKATAQLKQLLEYFSRFRYIAQAILEGDGDLCARTENSVYRKSLIDFELLAIQARKLQSFYSSNLAQRGNESRELDDAITKWNHVVKEATKEASISIKAYIKENVTRGTIKRMESQNQVSKIKENLQTVNGSLSETVDFVKSSTKSLRARRHYLEASLDALKRHYDNTIKKYQVKLDELQILVEANKKATEKLQKKFKHVEETYDEMRAMRRLKELLQNMQKAEAIKQNWAARKIQMQWRKYKLAKLRKKKLKGKKKGKKKTPPPQGKGSVTPSKTPTPASRSRSKSQTP